MLANASRYGHAPPCSPHGKGEKPADRHLNHSANCVFQSLFVSNQIHFNNANILFVFCKIGFGF
jgi:hypothetical protein